MVKMTKDEKDREIKEIRREAGQIWARIEQDYINLRYTERLKYEQIRLQELRNRLQELERSDEK